MKAHVRADDGVLRPDQRIGRRLERLLEFLPGIGCAPEQLEQSAALRRVLQDMKQADDLFIQIVVDLDLAARFPEQH